ncbi:CdvA-like protein [Candidatus Nitrosotenuis chungbukensis]|uniref:CdvA-like protein n=1 Tax=Candidatus Nitrosotenuis chungbukensis TaxID=1353246 RepID=UPI002673D20F|nr:CdvA-like protein [Candidatus Nitrosotenuis chungbukensis]WKT57342.1 CdvA-like protein [Candidatus Nitrosotenuis chungbukensis]
MNKDEIEIIGKQVKDMYGTHMGKVIGTITDIDGSVQTVGIDCGLEGLRQVPFEQLVVQGEVVIFIPKWRLDSQRFLREKGLTLRRLKALIDIVSENDDMRDDAEIIHEKYKSKLLTLEEAEKQITHKLTERLEELNGQLKSVKILLFDAKVQFKSNEISESKYDLIKTNTGEIIEHIDHEKAEIVNIQRRMTDMSIDGAQTQINQKEQIEQSAVSYLVTNDGKQVESHPTPSYHANEVKTEAPSPDQTNVQVSQLRDNIMWNHLAHLTAFLLRPNQLERNAGARL